MLVMEKMQNEQPVEERYETGQEEQESGTWRPDAGLQKKGLLGRLTSPFTRSFESLSSKQKGQFILIVAVMAFLVGIALSVMLILRYV